MRFSPQSEALRERRARLFLEDADELWAPVPGYEGFYEVSTWGRARSVHRVFTRSNGARMTVFSKILSPSLAGQIGYEVVAFSRGSGSRQRLHYIHSTVLAAFVGPRPLGYDSCHNDGDERNNRINNLRWDTRRENIRDLVKQGRHMSVRRRGIPLSLDTCRRLSQAHKKNWADPRLRKKFQKALLQGSKRYWCRFRLAKLFRQRMPLDPESYMKTGVMRDGMPDVVAKV